MEKEIKEIIAEQLDTEKEVVRDGANLEDELNMDDLDRVELTMALEDKFGIDISDEDAEKWVTVKDVIMSVMGIKKK